jgi:hypothetical protein
MKLANKWGWDFQKQDYDLARRLRADKEFKKEWNNATNNKLRARIRQIHAAHRNMKVQEIDETKIKPEITQIKGEFIDNHYHGFDRISRKDLQDAFGYVTPSEPLKITVKNT